jgi:dTDP-4-dehydrorhamnose 3,5-epimerase
MKFVRLKIPGPFVIKPNILKDARGIFFEKYRQKIIDLHGDCKIKFVQENQSISKKNVFRGFHFQISPYSQSKLVSVAKGKILDIIIDLRKNSKHFGKHLKIYLDSFSNHSLFVPKGFAHGFFALTSNVIVNYKVDNYYSQKHEKCLSLNDIDLKLNLKSLIKKSIVSEKDKSGLSLKEIFNNNYF